MRIVTLIFGLMLAFGAAAVALGEERITVPGSRVSMVPLPGFALVRGANSFKDKATGSSIFFISVPDEDYESYRSGMSDIGKANAAFGASGYELTKSDTLTLADGRTILVLGGTQTDGNTTTRNWIALAGPDPTLLITVEVAGTDGPDDAAVLEALQTIAFGPPLTLNEELAALPFEITSDLPFRHVTPTNGVGIILSTARLEVMTYSDSLMTLGWNFDSAATDVEALATELRAKGGEVSSAVIGHSEPVTFAGHPGIKVTGTAPFNGKPGGFAQYVALVEGGYVTLLAQTPEYKTEELLPVIDAIAATTEPSE